MLKKIVFNLRNANIIGLSFNFTEFAPFERTVDRRYGRDSERLLAFVWSIKSVEFVRQSFAKCHVDTSQFDWQLRGKFWMPDYFIKPAFHESTANVMMVMGLSGVNLNYTQTVSLQIVHLNRSSCTMQGKISLAK